MYGFGAEGAAGALVDELATVVAGVSLLIWGGGGLAGGSLALKMTKIIVFENVRNFSKKGLFFLPWWTCGLVSLRGGSMVCGGIWLIKRHLRQAGG